MNSRLFKACDKVCIACVLSTVLSIPFAAQAANVTAAYVAGADGLNPDDAAWNQAGTTTITLVRFIDYVEEGGGGIGGTDNQCMIMGVPINLPVAVSAVHNGNTIFFRYEWADATTDTTVGDTNLFGDALAMEIPYSGGGGGGGPGGGGGGGGPGGGGGGGGTSLAMGTQAEPVNIILWRADRPQPLNVVAGGIGTPQPSPDAQNLQHYQNWGNGNWSVIVSRPLTGASDNQITLLSGVTYSVAFANWNGSDKNRNGRKAISNWHTLTIE